MSRCNTSVSLLGNLSFVHRPPASGVRYGYVRPAKRKARPSFIAPCFAQFAAVAA